MQERESLRQLNLSFKNILNSVNNSYIHKEQYYESTHKIINLIENWYKLPVENPRDAILVLGKTGWGKSTFINYIQGVPLIINENGHLEPKNKQEAVTKIGIGIGSTTMAPRLCSTRVGYIWDLPGDQDTGGPIAQLINSIVKKNMGKIVKNTKLIIMLPSSDLKPQGSYGKGLKDILLANDKFLKGINKYKQHIMFVITFGSRKQRLQNVCESIRDRLNHQDKILQDYRELLQYVIENKRIKLFPNAQEIDEGQRQIVQYNIPAAPQWKQHTIQQIIKAITSIQFKTCTQNDFSVPHNSKTKIELAKLNEVVKQKIRDRIQKQSFNKIKFSGLQLKYVKDILINLNIKQTIQQLTQIADKTTFIKMPNLSTQKKQMQFISMFLNDQNKMEKLDNNWVNAHLNQRLNQQIQQMQFMIAKKGDDFRKHYQSQFFSIVPNSLSFYQIQAKTNQLKQEYLRKIQLQIDKTRNTSDFYENYMEKVFDKVVEDIVKYQQSYVDYQNQKKKVKVPQNIQYDIPIQRQKIRFEKAEQKYIQNVPKVRTVVKTVTQNFTTRGGRKYGVVGKRSTQHHQASFTYETCEIYYENQQKTRIIDKPIIDNYTEYIKGNKVQFKQKQEIQRVAVQKQRQSEIKVQKNIFKDEKLQRFNNEKYTQQLGLTQMKITQIKQEVNNLIITAPEYSYNCQLKQCKVQVRDSVEEYYIDLLKEWKILEQRAFIKYHHNKIYENE